MTLNDFIMESAIVETTNDTAVSDIQMEQWNAEIKVGMAMLNCMEKYAMLSEYATCDIDEFFEEGAKLDAKIDSVDEWKNSGGKVKKVLGTIGSGILKGLRAIANFFKNLFSKDKNPFAKAKKLIEKMKLNSKKSLKTQLEEANTAVKNLQNDTDALYNANAALAKKNQQTTAELNKSRDEIDNLRAERAETNERMKKYVNEVMVLTAHLDTLKEKNANLVDTIDKLNKALKQAESDKSDFIKEIQNLTEDFDVVSREFDAAQQENADLKSKNRNLNMTVEAAKAKLTQYESESTELSAKVNAILPVLDDYFAKVKEGKISVDRRTKSYRTIKEFYDTMLKMKTVFSKL